MSIETYKKRNVLECNKVKIVRKLAIIIIIILKRS
jgi:hypothetical protein